MRRLPVYILLDTSGSMRGEPILAVDNGLQVMLETLRQDPHALDTVHLCLIGFDLEVKVIQELTPIDSFPPVHLATPESGPTFLGEALKTVAEKAAREVRKSDDAGKGDWQPLLFVMTDGKPSDTMVFEEQCAAIKRAGFAAVVGCAAGPKADPKLLQRFCTQTAALDTLDGPGFERFFTWVSDVIADGSRSQGVGAPSSDLPPPPDEIKIAL